MIGFAHMLTHVMYAHLSLHNIVMKFHMFGIGVARSSASFERIYLGTDQSHVGLDKFYTGPHWFHKTKDS